MNAPVSFLSEVALFNSLSIATLENLSSAGRIHKYEKGNIICRKGDPALNFFVVLSGEVSEIVEDDNDFTTTSVLKGRGDYFGELGILLEETFATTAVAAGFAEIFVIPRQTASETLWNHRASMKQILRLFHRGLQNSASRFISCTNFNVEGRLAYNLLLMVPREGGGVVETTQENLSRHCGISRQTVSAILNGWKKSGVISIARGRIVIENRDLLADILLENSKNS